MTRVRRLLAATLVGVVAAVVGPAAPTGPASAQQGGVVSVPWDALPRGWPAPGSVTASAFVLLDADTGQVLAERDADEPLLVASTVKILTVLTALDHVADDTVVTVGGEVQIGGAGVGLDPGEQWRIDDLLEAVIVRSGNDAARALAVHVGGSIPTFVEMMRAKAEELGIAGAVINEPTGLDDNNRLSARDLAVVTRAAMQDGRFRDVAGRRTVDLPDLGTVATRNLLLDRYPDAIGVKTGYTDLAGWCLVAAAARDGREFVAVVLGARTDEDRFADAETLLDFGFSDHVAAQLPASLRLRRAGGWVQHELPVGHVWMPAVEPGEVVVQVPREVTEPVKAAATWRGLPVGTWDAQVLPTDVAADDALGAILADAMYRSMRSAHRAGLWGADPQQGR